MSAFGITADIAARRRHVCYENVPANIRYWGNSGHNLVLTKSHHEREEAEGDMRYLVIASGLVAALLATTTMSKTGTAADNTVNREFAECLMSHVRTGKYRSVAVTQATIRLLGDCAAEWEAFANVCMRRNRTDLAAQKNCNLKGSLLAAVALKMGNDPDTRAWDNFVDQFNSISSGN